MKWEEPASRGRRRFFFFVRWHVAMTPERPDIDLKLDGAKEGREGDLYSPSHPGIYLLLGGSTEPVQGRKRGLGAPLIWINVLCFFLSYSSIFPSTFCRSFSPWIHLSSEPLKKSGCLRQTARRTFSQLLLDSTRLDVGQVLLPLRASSGSQSAQKKTPNGNRTNHATKS